LAYNLFAQAEPELVTWLRSNASTVAVAEQTCIVREGARNEGLYIVESGRLRIATTTADGASVALGEQGAGSMVGDMSWLENRPAVANVLADAGSQLLHLSPTALEALARAGQPAAALLYRAIGSKLSLQIQSQNAWIHRFAASPHESLRKVLVLFADLNEHDVDWLRQLGQLRRLPAGGVLIDEGEPVTALALILAGEARIQVSSEGRLQTVGSSRRGELLGEMSLLNRDGRGASARVDTPAGLELLSLDIDALLAALAGDAARATRFWRALARMLSQRSRDQLLQRGLAATSRQVETDDDSDDEEIDMTQLSGISTAGARFDWLCRQFQNQQG
jgi:bacteriocin-type transport-associated protein